MVNYLHGSYVITLVPSNNKLNNNKLNNNKFIIVCYILLLEYIGMVLGREKEE